MFRIISYKIMKITQEPSYHFCKVHVCAHVSLMIVSKLHSTNKYNYLIKFVYFVIITYVYNLKIY